MRVLLLTGADWFPIKLELLYESIWLEITAFGFLQVGENGLEFAWDNAGNCIGVVFGEGGVGGEVGFEHSFLEVSNHEQVLEQTVHVAGATKVVEADVAN